jgi:photosystem II stability/assembly factor-like uncharacterized protein
MNRIVFPLIVIVCFMISFLFVTSDESADSTLSVEQLDRALGFPATHASEAIRWYNDQRSYPTGTIPVDWREKAVSHVQKNNFLKTSSSSTVAWVPVGPDNIGGRVRSIVHHPTISGTLYCGSVSGGIWKTTNGGSSWTPLGDFAPSLVIGALAIDPTNTNVIYAGTGEGYFNTDALRGIGVLKTTDGGATWATQATFTGSGQGFPYYINDIYLRPDSTNILYAATNSGLFRTTNGGTNWTFMKRGDLTYRATQIAVDPTNPRTFYICFGNFSRDGIYKTTNGGGSFTKLAGGFPTTGFYRISLAIAKSNPQILYAVLIDSFQHEVHSVQKSTNGGTNWTAVTTPMDGSIPGSGLVTFVDHQGWYNNVIAVHPTDANLVYAGGINVFKSVTGGTAWSMMTDGYPPSVVPYMHVDQHGIVFDPNNPAVMYFGNDGGMYKSTNGGTSISSINNGLSITQFYSGAIHPTQEIYYGGTQDNGTLKSSALPAWEVVLGGDGGATEVDFTTPTNVFTEYVFLCIQKSTNSGANLSWTRTMNGIPVSGSQQGDGTSDRCNFIAPFVMAPSNSQILVAGTYRAFRTTNSGVSWTAISGDLTGSGAGSVGTSGSVISTIAIANSNSNVIYVGTTGYAPATVVARIQVTTNAGSSWTDLTKAPLPDRYVKALAIDAADANRTFAAYSGYNTNTPGTPGHLFRTTNRGTSWTNVSGDLPDIPVNAISLDPTNQSHIIIGTDIGIFETFNDGTNWLQQNTGMANVSVADLDLRADGYLFAATHGRGMYKSTTTTDVQEIPGEVPSSFVLNQNYPNPFNPSTKISFTIPSRSHVQLKVYDVAGREVAVLVDEELSAGTYSSPFIASGLASGVYFYAISVEDKRSEASQRSFSETKKMMLIK